MSVAYIGRKLRTERPRKTKIGTEVARITRDSDTNFKVKRSKVNLQGAGHIVAASRTSCAKSNTEKYQSVLHKCNPVSMQYKEVHYTVGWDSATSPFKLLTMYSRSRFEIRGCSAGVLLVRSSHNTIVIVDVIPV